jgi:hypothetical protein
LHPRTCDHCDARLRKGWAFAFQARGPRGPDAGQAPIREGARCVWCALKHPALLRRSLIASVVVGTTLTLLNQGDTLLSGQWNNGLSLVYPHEDKTGRYP